MQCFHLQYVPITYITHHAIIILTDILPSSLYIFISRSYNLQVDTNDILQYKDIS